ncbi:MAG: YIP1 family protein [Bacteroidota bacterium]|jgi:hypothetical protein
MPEEFITPQPSNEMSLSDKFVGILSSPGEVYQSIVGTEPKTSNWAIPLVLTIIVGIIFTFVVFSQPPIQDQMIETQHKALQQRVDNGKMTQEQMVQTEEMNPAKPGSPMFLIFGTLGVVVVLVFSLFAYSAVYIVVGKILFKSSVTYKKVLEVNGLSYYVAAIVSLLSMVIVVSMGSLYASISPTLFIADFDPLNTEHKFLAALNLLEFWNLFVIGVGLSKIWNVSTGKALGAVGGVWLIWTLIKVFVDFGF